MSSKWEKLERIEVIVDGRNSARETDKYYASVLARSCKTQDLYEFYNALFALERGCGLPSYEEIGALCNACIVEDRGRFLKLVNDKRSRFTIVILLMSVEHKQKVEWISLSLLGKGFLFFETLRQLLSCSNLSQGESSTVATGLCQLAQVSKLQFRFLYERYLIYRPLQVQIVSEMFQMLPLSGWEVIGSCSVFHHFDATKARYWEKYAENQTWLHLAANAEPFLTAWLQYAENLENRTKARTSLYNNYSIFIVNILGEQLEIEKRTTEILLEALNNAESRMLEWYANEYDQKCVLLSQLSIIEHVRQAIIIKNLSRSVFSTDSANNRTLHLLEQTSHLWNKESAFSTIRSEVERMKIWILQNC